MLNAMVILLGSNESVQAAEHGFGRWGRILERASDRASSVARRGGSLPGVASACSWLASTVEEGIFAAPEAAPLRDEVLRCVARIRQCTRWAVRPLARRRPIGQTGAARPSDEAGVSGRLVR